MVMNRVNIHEAKAKLSELVDAVASGTRVVICRRNQPVAEIVPAAPMRTEPRPIGTARGLVRVPKSFFDALSDDLVLSFYPRAAVPEAEASALPGAPRPGRRRASPHRKGRRA